MEETRERQSKNMQSKLWKRVGILKDFYNSRPVWTCEMFWKIDDQKYRNKYPFLLHSKGSPALMTRRSTDNQRICCEQNPRVESSDSRKRCNQGKRNHVAPDVLPFTGKHLLFQSGLRLSVSLTAFFLAIIRLDPTDFIKWPWSRTLLGTTGSWVLHEITMKWPLDRLLPKFQDVSQGPMTLQRQSLLHHDMKRIPSSLSKLLKKTHCFSISTFSEYHESKRMNY